MNTYYPLPNIAPNTLYDNYQANFPGSSHSSQLSGRFNRSFGATPTRGQRGGFGGPRRRRRQSECEADFAAEHRGKLRVLALRERQLQLFATAERIIGKQWLQRYSSYTVGYGRINSTATLGWNRSRSLTSNLFTNGSVNPAVTAGSGIFVGNPQIYTNPFYFGVPSLSATGVTGISGLGESSNPGDTINQTISLPIL